MFTNAMITCFDDSPVTLAKALEIRKSYYDLIMTSSFDTRMREYISKTNDEFHNVYTHMRLLDEYVNECEDMNKSFLAKHFKKNVNVKIFTDPIDCIILKMRLYYKCSIRNEELHEFE